MDVQGTTQCRGGLRQFSRADHFYPFHPTGTRAGRTGHVGSILRKMVDDDREHLPRELLELPACLARLVPPARIIDKRIYSPWLEGQLHQTLRQCGVDTVVLTGGETDVCVLATVLGAVDLGYRVLVLEDAVCSGADQTHDAALRLLGERFSAQLTLCTTADFLHSKGDVRALTPPSR